MCVMIGRFDGEYRFLSNFYEHPMVFHGLIWLTAEHAFQACKTADHQEQWAILNAATPGMAKRLGRKATLVPDWEETKLSWMTAVVTAKFYDATLRQKLLATGDEELVEGNTWNDTYWGVCRGEGQNHLGTILMLVRHKYRQ